MTQCLVQLGDAEQYVGCFYKGEAKKGGVPHFWVKNDGRHVGRRDFLGSLR